MDQLDIQDLQLVITPNEIFFVHEYARDFNASRAYVAAGLSNPGQGPAGIVKAAKRLLMQDEIQAALQSTIATRTRTLNITNERVLFELARIALFDIRDLYHADGVLKLPHELSDDCAAVVASFKSVEMAGAMSVDDAGEVRHIPMYAKEVKLVDKIAALTLLMRHAGMLNDKLELTLPKEIASRLNRARDRLGLA